MNRPDPNSGGDQLLHCNPERTLLLCQDPANGRAIVLKLLLRGSAADAAHECEMGQRVGHLDVVRYLDAPTDAASGRPCVRMEFHPGTNLDELVAQRGALPAADACRLLLPVARTLAAMHSLRGPDLPQGLCHGDVKPGNLLQTPTTTLLLDFEHAGPTHRRAAAGTPAFAAPEAEIGAPLHPSFDVYGLGATLLWLLTGRPTRRARIDTQDRELQLLVDACVARSPMARPSATVVADALAELATRLEREPAEALRSALLTGDLDGCERGLLVHPDAELERALARRRRCMRRRPALFELAAESPGAIAEPAVLTAQLRQLAQFTRCFPRHATAARMRVAGKRRAGELLATELPRIFDLVGGEYFTQATSRLQDLRVLTNTALALPGALRIPGKNGGRMPTLLQRAPLSCLDQERHRLDAAVAEHAELLATLHAAEGALALDDASNAIDNIGSRYGGTSDAVARHRDRLHRLGFYIERIGRARPNIQRLYELVPDQDPAALLTFVDECAAAVVHAEPSDDRSVGALGLRSLHLALGNLHEEFPAVRERAAPGLAGLDRALAHVTDEAWRLLADAQQKLQTQPVPVRPLQLVLGRLDTFRALEALVDRPQHSRSQLVDRIEWLRLRLEQAQATRDRLARGAEQALAKGHWTTGLFDMERAVTQLQHDDDLDDRQAMQLRQRLSEARKRKQEIESAQRRHHELASRYAALQDDAESTTTERLSVLREHRDCLQFLAVHVPQDRSQLYARDLRDVELRMAQEDASQAEAELDLADAPVERLRIAAQALAKLEALAGTSEPGAELPGRLRRLIDHWRRRHDNEQRQLQQRLADERNRRRRRWLTTWAVSAGIALAAIGLRSWSGTPHAGSLQPLQQAARELPGSMQSPAADLAAAAAQLPVDDPRALVTTLATAIETFLQQTGAQAAEPARAAFARRVWLHSLAEARAHLAAGPDSGVLEAAVAAAAGRLHSAGLPE